MKVTVPKRNEEEDELDEEKQAWLQNPMTNAVRESVRKNVRIQQSELFAACMKSTDPDVRGAYMKYRELQVMQAMLEEGK